MTHKHLTKRSPHVSISYDKRNPYYEENFNKQLTKILEKLEENLRLFHGGLVRASDEDPCACS